MVTSKIIFKIKKPKIINITNNDYKELTCFIFVANQLTINNNKQIKLGYIKLFLNNTSLFMLNKKYDYTDINPSLFNSNININTIKRIYNRNNITIYVLNINFVEQTININNNIFSEKKYILFLKKNVEDEDENYDIIPNKNLNGHLNDILITPYFTIKLKYILSTIWNY